MKALIVALILLISPLAQSFERDKALHLGYSTVISAGTYSLFRLADHSKGESLIVAVTYTMAIGIAKEFSDPKFDGRDLAYDALGALLGPILVINF